jgi:hypothetical protein
MSRDAWKRASFVQMVTAAIAVLLMGTLIAALFGVLFTMMGVR